MTAAFRPNRPNRPRVVEARSIAAEIRRTFTDKDARREKELPFSWPARMQHVGDSLAVAYASDKWQKPGDYELYKHLAESTNRVLVVPGFLCAFDDTRRPWPTVGPVISFGGMPMPKHFAVLGYFEEADLRLYATGPASAPAFGRGKDDGVVKVMVRHGMLGAGKIRWSAVGDGEDEPFLFVYTEARSSGERGGVKMIVVGDELDIEKDGIVG